MFIAFHPQPKMENVGSSSGQAQNAAVGGSTASLTLVKGHAYRILATTDCYLRFSVGAASATSADILLTSRTPLYVLAKNWDTLSFIQDTAAGKISVTEIQYPL